MSGREIASIHARAILDSRGYPTVEADVTLADGTMGRAAVPSGASTGTHEALELRDGKRAYGGRGVDDAIANIRGVIATALTGLDATDQCLVDSTLIAIDDTSDKSSLGANAILGVSLACAKAAAAQLSIPLWRHVGGVSARAMPVPMMNIVNGGEHANNAIDIQEFMVMPVAATSIRQAVDMGAEIFHALKSELARDGYATSVGDEGGFAPDFKTTKQALDYILRAGERAGLSAGSDVLLALDCAASEYFEDGIYNFSGEGVTRTIEHNIEFLADLVDTYPIISIEDGCAEDDWDGWRALTDRLGQRCQLVGDDLFTTNRERLARGIRDGCANALLVKVNQVGTLTETLDAVEMAHRAGFTTIMSHRSGETEDITIADLAVATNCGQIKTGSLARTDRTAKYNQLMRIEEHLAETALFSDRRFRADNRFQCPNGHPTNN